MATPAVATEGGIVLWNERIAASLDDVVAEDGSCRGGTERALNHGCVERALNRTRKPFVVVSLLDEIALMVVRYTNPTFDQSIGSHAKIEFAAQSPNIISDKIEAHVYLKFQW